MSDYEAMSDYLICKNLRDQNELDQFSQGLNRVGIKVSGTHMAAIAREAANRLEQRSPETVRRLEERIRGYEQDAAYRHGQLLVKQRETQEAVEYMHRLVCERVDADKRASTAATLFVSTNVAWFIALVVHTIIQAWVK